MINEQVLDRQTGRWLWHAGGAAGVRGTSRGTDGDVAPVVDGPTIIVMRHGTLEGRDPRSGRVRWTRRQRGFAPPPGAGGTGIAVGPSTVVVGRSEAPGALTTDAIALDRATGKERWAANIPSGPITLTRNIVMVEGGALRGLDLNTGALRWEAQVASVSVAVGVDADAAVVANIDGIDAFDAVTGSQRWTVARSDHFLVQPGSGVVMMYRTNEPTRLVVDIKTGAERARFDAANSEILPLSARRFVRAGLDVYEGIRADGRVVWTTPKARGFESENDALVGDDLVTIPDHCER